MIIETLQQVSARLSEMAATQQKEIVQNPKIGEGRDSFLWKCGYASGLDRARELIDKIINEGDEA